MAASPAYTNVVGTEMASIATANAGRDGTGTVGTVLTAGSNGTKIEQVRIKAIGTTTAGMVRLFLYDGANYFLLDEQTIAAVTPSATVKGEQYDLFYPNLIIPTGWSLRAATEKAETFKIIAFGGDY